jgi:NAD(P)-dependent dehydrogenase (short-subunit alcohol dehydrogenase family)
MEQHQSSPLQPPQHQDRQPGIESAMTPRPRAEDPSYQGSGKLHGKVALITGDSGIGRAVALFFAKEGADVALVYLNEHDDAVDAQRRVEAAGRRCVTFAGDVGREPFCQDVVEQTVAALGQLDILVNNAAE